MLFNFKTTQKCKRSSDLAVVLAFEVGLELVAALVGPFFVVDADFPQDFLQIRLMTRINRGSKGYKLAQDARNWCKNSKIMSKNEDIVYEPPAAGNAN